MKEEVAEEENVGRLPLYVLCICLFTFLFLPFYFLFTLQVPLNQTYTFREVPQNVQAWRSPAKEAAFAPLPADVVPVEPHKHRFRDDADPRSVQERESEMR